MKKTTTIIFGGKSGIGLAISEIFRGRGDDVYTVSRRHINSSNHISFDFCSDKNFSFKFPVDHLVFSQRYRGYSQDEEIKVMLTQPTKIVEELVKFMNPGGSITFLGSTAGSFTVREQPLHYHQIRAAIEAMTRFFAVRFGKFQIRCNCVIPTRILKPGNESYYTPDNTMRQQTEKITPLGRMGTALDVANVVSFFGSPEASFVNGQCITVDGGTSALGHETVATAVNS